jgi:hypothetical protein
VRDGAEELRPFSPQAPAAVSIPGQAGGPVPVVK